MKSWDDLTDEEVLALTDDALDTYVLLACAEQGVALPIDAGPKPEAPEAKPDVAVFEVAGELFTDRDEAMRIADVINGCTSRVSDRYFPGCGYSHKGIAADRVNEVVVRPERRWTDEAWAAHGQVVTAHHEASEAWRKRTEEAAAATKEREAIVERIRGYRRDLEAREAERERWAGEMARYREIGLDDAQAHAALILAHPRAEEFVEAPVEAPEPAPLEQADFEPCDNVEPVEEPYEAIE